MRLLKACVSNSLLFYLGLIWFPCLLKWVASKSLKFFLLFLWLSSSFLVDLHCDIRWWFCLHCGFKFINYFSKYIVLKHWSIVLLSSHYFVYLPLWFCLTYSCFCFVFQELRPPWKNFLLCIYFYVWLF